MMGQAQGASAAPSAAKETLTAVTRPGPPRGSATAREKEAAKSGPGAGGRLPFTKR